jgi:hypothetical protein
LIMRGDIMKNLHAPNALKNEHANLKRAWYEESCFSCGFSLLLSLVLWRIA